MSNYAVISISGKQYKISEGDTLLVDSLENKAGSEMLLDKVLLARMGDKIQIGQPYVPNVKITASVETHQKGNKIHIRKFKAKSRYRRHIGFRPSQTVLKIGNISPSESNLREKEIPSPKKSRKVTA